jgi:chemotaxis protein MotB
MSKKPRQEEVEEEEVAPFWMISFSDLMTLLLSFFIILFSISTIETKKMEELMSAMGDRYLSQSSSLRKRISRHLTADPTLPKAKEPTAPLTIEPKEKFSSKGTIIPFALEITELNEETKKILARVAEDLHESSLPIAIRGHASNNEKSRRVVDDLAYERAWNVRQFLETFELDPKRFALVIVGPHDPLSHDSLTPDFGDVNTYVEVIQENDDAQ